MVGKKIVVSSLKFYENMEYKMAKPYITIGCPTTGGGTVLTGESRFLVEGLAVACVGDTASCPLHNTVAVIISGDAHLLAFGKPVARINDVLSCGCRVLSKQSLVLGEN